MIGILAVFLGGGLGSSLRYAISLFANKHFGVTYWATFVINVLGSLLLGFVVTLAINNPALINSDFKLFLTTGIAGGFTTFSTFSYENLVLIKEGKISTSALYIFSSLVFGFLAVYCGFLLAGLI